MKKALFRPIALGVVMACLAGAGGLAPAQASDINRLHLYIGADDFIFGYDLMTDAERDRYRWRMHNARTWAERERIRREHRLFIQQRAHDRGLRLAPPPRQNWQGRHGRQRYWR